MLLVASLFLSSSALAQKLTLDPQLPDIDALFRDFDRATVAGAAVAVVVDGEVVHRAGYGAASLEDRVAASVRTNFRLASVTKQFIGLAVAQQIERGTLRLDQRLTDFFPSFPAYGRAITVDHLVHHTSGLQDYEDLIPAGRTEQLSDRDVLTLLASVSRTQFPPGTQYAYSNGGYVLLGLILEEATRKRLDQLLREEIFQPAGMHASVVYQGEGTAIEQRAFGYAQVGSGFRRTDQSVTSATRGDGGIYSSVLDLVAWEAALESGRLANVDSMRRIFEPGRLRDGTPTTYGYGWSLGSYRGFARQSHTGSSVGFRTVIHRFPAQRAMIAVLVNRDAADPSELANAIADRVLP